MEDGFILRRWKTLVVVGTIAMIITTGLYTRSVIKAQLQYKRTKGKHTINQFRHLAIPSDEVLFRMNDTLLDDIYHRYLTKSEVFCSDIVRLGKKTDGGWDICADSMYRPRENCLVYSFGIAFDFSFDDGMAEQYGCEVHSFDPIMRKKDHMHSSYVSFHATGLSNSNETVENTNGKWRMRTFKQLLVELNHNKDVVDVLKMDIEGWEWKALPEMMESGSLNNVRQLAVEFHFGEKIKMMKGNVATTGHYIPRLQIIRTLHNFGFRIFYTHRNMHCAFSDGEKTRCHGVSFIQTKFPDLVFT